MLGKSSNAQSHYTLLPLSSHLSSLTGVAIESECSYHTRIGQRAKNAAYNGPFFSIRRRGEGKKRKQGANPTSDRNNRTKNCACVCADAAVPRQDVKYLNALPRVFELTHTESTVGMVPIVSLTSLYVQRVRRIMTERIIYVERERKELVN